MHRVVIDTNVIVSAFISSKGNPAKIVNAVVSSEDFIICYNGDILAEYEDVLTRAKFDKYNFSPAEIANFIKKVQEIGILIEPPASDISMPDESDRIFYDTATEGGAILITGNAEHYPPEDFVVTPAIFLQIINSTA